MVLQEDERLHSSRFSARYSTICSARAVALDAERLSPRRRVLQRKDGRARATFPDLAAVDAEVAEREHLLRLLLRTHDSLERRVAGLVDRVGDADHGRERRADHVVAELGLTAAVHCAVGHRQLGDLRHHRPAQPFGHRRPQHRALGVARILAEEDEVGRLTLEHGGEHSARRERVGAGGGVVADEDRPVGAHRERLAHGVAGGRRPHCHEHHLAVAPGLLEAQRLLDGVRVEGVERALAGAVEPLRRRVDPLRRGVRDLLHTDGDLHAGPDSRDS